MGGVDGQAAIRRHAAFRVTLLSHRQTMHTRFRFAGRRSAALAVLFLLNAPAFAQAPANPPSLEERVAKVESSVGDAALAGDNAWMLTSSALVLMMTGAGPGHVLRRPGPQEERAGRDDAVHVPDGPDDGDLGRCMATRWRSAATADRAAARSRTSATPTTCS